MNRSNAVLFLFRFVALLLILLGTVHFVGLLLMLLSDQTLLAAFGNQGANALLGWLMMIGPTFQPPLLIIAAGAMLFVLVEIALRLDRPRDKDA